MKKSILISLLTCIALSGTAGPSFALSKSTKFTILVVDEENIPLSDIRVGVGFERNVTWGTKSSGQSGITDAGGKLTFSGESNGHITYGGRMDGYYPSYYDYDFKDLGAFGWKPWNPELKVVMRKIENPVPMYARDTKFSNLKVPTRNKDIGFDLIKFDWVPPYGAGAHSDFLINLSSSVTTVKDYDFTATIKFNGPNGVIPYTEDTTNGSQFTLPRNAPEFGYKKELSTFDRAEGKKGRSVSWGIDQHYIFRVRATLADDKSLQNALYGKIIGDIRLGPQKDGSALLQFKYYLNPDGTRNLEFDPNRNFFNNLSPMERIKNP